MQDDDKTVIIHSGAQHESSTEVNHNATDIVSFPKETLPPAEHSYNIPFMDTQHNQPFLSALRALYRDVQHLRAGRQSEIQTIRRKLIQTMDMQTKSMSEQGYDNTHIMIVRYILSTFIDEILGTVEWAGGEAWANHSLLSHYYKETYGGEKFFQLLEQFVQEPTKYMQHMKLVYACLSLGYKGRYSMQSNTDVQVEAIRQELYGRIKNFDSNDEKFYENHPASRKRHKLTLYVPYKLYILGGLLILGIVYGIFTSIVSTNENTLIEKLDQKPVTTVEVEKDHNGSK